MAGDFRFDERALSERELNDAAAVASRAFYDDSYFRYLFADDAVRARVQPLIFRTQLKHIGSRARIATVRDDRDAIVAVSAWMLPHSFPPSLRVQLAQLPGSLRAFYRQLSALRVVGTYLRTLLKVHPKDPHWYLMLLAVDPPLQRRGAGTMLCWINCGGKPSPPGSKYSSAIALLSSGIWPERQMSHKVGGSMFRQDSPGIEGSSEH